VARTSKKNRSEGPLQRKAILIFVTVGTADKGIEFTRLIVKMDEIAGKIEEEVVMQIGSIEYVPKHAQSFRYTNFADALSYFQKASLVVGHGGTGTILNALRFRVPLIVVPRRIQFGELDRDDHQLEIAQQLDGHVLIAIVYDVGQLEPKILQMLEGKKKGLQDAISPERTSLIKFLSHYLKEAEKSEHKWKKKSS